MYEIKLFSSACMFLELPSGWRRFEDLDSQIIRFTAVSTFTSRTYASVVVTVEDASFFGDTVAKASPYQSWSKEYIQSGDIGKGNRVVELLTAVPSGGGMKAVVVIAQTNCADDNIIWDQCLSIIESVDIN
nr:hypothetical protein [Corynebacterium lactis]